MMEGIDLTGFRQPLFFIGAGMSAESGVPTYRGAGGIWSEYRFEDYACQQAFERDPDKVLDFHVMRREKVLACAPHAGHWHLARLQDAHPAIQVVTQNTDGMLQRAGIKVAAELHGSLWHLRCHRHGALEDSLRAEYQSRRCQHCDRGLRPDITWFHDPVDRHRFGLTEALVRAADLFISIGTSGVVWPAAGFAQLAREYGATMIEINPEENEASELFDHRLREPASLGLSRLFPLEARCA